MLANRSLRVAIVHYRDDPAAGGSLRVGEVLTRHLDPARVEAHLLFAYGGPGPVSRRASVPCHFLGARNRRDIRAWLRARATIRMVDPDILHFVDSVGWLYCASAWGRWARLVHVHGRPGPALPRHGARTPWLDRGVARALALSADGQVCITRGAERALRGLGWGRTERLWTVRNGVDCKWFEDLPPRTLARAQLRLPSDVRTLGMVCRLVRYRGCDDAVRILRRLDGDWHLVLVGEGPARRDIEALAERDGIRHRVHFTGLLEDVRPAYAAMDGFLFLARYDSFGLATCEAMAAGVPVFGLGGAGEYREADYPLLTAENAVLVERRRPDDFDSPESAEVLDALAARIREYGFHPERYRPMVEEARRWVRERFDAAVQAAAMARVYETVLKRRAP